MPGVPLEILDWRRTEYGEALSRQLLLVEKRISDSSPDRLILTEHPPVVTIGSSGGPSDLLVSAETLQRAGIGLYKVNRGGRATYHEPGQLVAYPIVKLKVKDLHLYLRTFLEAVADLLRRYGIKPEFKPGRPGLWVAGSKIASIGISVRRWVTYHGLALNVNNDLSGFDWIVPCGQPEESVTTMARCLGRPLDAEAVKAEFTDCFRNSFGYPRAGTNGRSGRHPAWLTRPAPSTSAIARMEERLKDWRLATVCQSAHCPNLGECFKRGTATFMILGKQCTRSCRFCAVDKGSPLKADPEEPARVARAARNLALRYVVITSVTRDDLPDGGAEQFRRVIEQVRLLCPKAGVEVLVPDFQGSLAALRQVVGAGPDMFNHNLETVARLYPAVRPQAQYRRSLAVLEYAARSGLAVKSGLMLGLGETEDEIMGALTDLKRAGCRYLTLGQYLAPSPKHTPVVRYVPPPEFDHWSEKARAMGFRGVASGPLVRSSYRAEDMFNRDPREKEQGHG
jgi:lipoic acid synthetase